MPAKLINRIEKADAVMTFGGEKFHKDANFSKNRNFSYGFYLTKFEKVLENKGFVRNNDT